MWWGYHGFGFNPFCGIFFMLFIAFVVFRIFAFRRCGGSRGWCNGRFDGRDGRFEAEAILKRRLVNGEINEEEYQRLKDILSK